MKTFIISIFTFLIILILITCFLFFLKDTTNDLTYQIDKILIEVDKENWTLAENEYLLLEKNWKKKKKLLEAFSNHSKTDQISVLIKEMNVLIDSNNQNQIKLYCDKIKLLFHLLYDDELPTFENII